MRATTPPSFFALLPLLALPLAQAQTHTPCNWPVTTTDVCRPSTATATATGTATSAPITTAASTTASSTSTGAYQPYPTLSLSEPAANCSCGYSVQSLGGTYFPYRFAFAFSSETDRVISGVGDPLSEKGWVINDGRHAGGEGPNGTQCWGRAENLRIDAGDLVLRVPGGQELGGDMDCAEISHGESVTMGVFQAEAKISEIAGTCEAFWLNHTIADTFADEVDIEILTGKIESDGIYFTNWPAFGNPNEPSTLQSNYTQVPFPDLANCDPTQTYNNYTIVWLSERNGRNSTTRYYNGVAQDSPTTNLPVHPMNYTINNWMNGAQGWSGGPPTEDADLRVKNVILYYRTETASSIGDLSSLCSSNDVCKV
ncbi:hypothetical protein IAT38_003577 [Cryptococcus sp. DSM 104549]